MVGGTVSVVLLLQARPSSLVLWYMVPAVSLQWTQFQQEHQGANGLEPEGYILCLFQGMARRPRRFLGMPPFHVQVQDVRSRRSTTVMWVAGAMPDAESKTASWNMPGV
jgi:hypothetical protein